MRSVQICCEGPSCNGGQAAADREAVIVRELTPQTAEMHEAAVRHARHKVSHDLTVTVHMRIGTATQVCLVCAVFACGVCGHQRVYGNSAYYP